MKKKPGARPGCLHLHPGNESQRDHVLDLAKKLNGIISISDIAADLGVTNKEIYGNYSRLLYHNNTRENDFRKIVDEVPFHSAAIFQLVTEPLLSEEEIQKCIEREEITYKKTSGLFYSVHLSPKLNPRMPQLAWLNIPKSDSVKDYVNMIPANIRNDYFVQTKGNSKGPREDDAVPVYTKDTWKEFIIKEG